MSLARRVGPLQVPAATWITARAFSRNRLVAVLGLAGAAAAVLIGALRGAAYIDADRTGFVVVQPRSHVRTAGTLVVLLLAGLVVLVAVETALVVGPGLLPALLVLLVVLPAIALSAGVFAVSLAAGLESSGTPKRPTGSLRALLALAPTARIWEVTSVAQLPGTRTRAALAMTREVVAARLRPDDVLVVQAGTPRLRAGYLRLGFAPGPGDLVVHRVPAPTLSVP